MELTIQLRCNARGDDRLCGAGRSMLRYSRMDNIHSLSCEL